MDSNHNYRFRIHRLKVGDDFLYQLRVGLDGDREFEYVPVHLTAFAESVDLESVHTTEEEVNGEMNKLSEWIVNRLKRKTGPDSEGDPAAFILPG